METIRRPIGKLNLLERQIEDSHSNHDPVTRYRLILPSFPVPVKSNIQTHDFRVYDSYYYPFGYCHVDVKFTIYRILIAELSRTVNLNND